LVNLIKVLSIFIVVSAIPFHLGLIRPLGSAYNIDIYEAGDNVYSYVGIFQNAHASAIVTSMSVINLMFLYFITKKKYLIVLVGIGFYSIYSSYVRTSYLMLIVGVLILLHMIIKKKLRMSFLYYFLLILTSFLFYYLYNNDAVFSARLIGKTKYMSENRSISSENISSMRTVIWYTNLAFWSEGNLIEKIFGYGDELSKDNMMKKTGMRVFSHNGFIDKLVQDGIIGLGLFMFYLFYIYKLVSINKDALFYPLGFATFSCYVFFNITQGGNIFLFEILFALNVVLVKTNTEIIWEI